MEAKLGYIINAHEMEREMLNRSSMLLINCSEKIDASMFLEQYSELNINMLLSDKMRRIDLRHRNLSVQDELNKILSSVKGELWISDFEMLFNPDYQVDVLKYFIDLSMRRKLVLKWCGYVENEYLKYSKPEFNDYKSYRIADNNIICVV